MASTHIAIQIPDDIPSPNAPTDIAIQIPPPPNSPPPPPFRRVWIRSAIFAAIGVVNTLATTIIGGLTKEGSPLIVISDCLYLTFTGACGNALNEFFSVALDSYMQQNHHHQPPQSPSAKWKAATASFLSYSLFGLLQVPSLVLAGPGIPRLVIEAALCALSLSLSGCFSAHYGNASFAKTILRLLFGGAATFGVSFGLYQALSVSFFHHL